jgi:hypothetical protein
MKTSDAGGTGIRSPACPGEGGLRHIVGIGGCSFVTIRQSVHLPRAVVDVPPWGVVCQVVGTVPVLGAAMRLPGVCLV